jgi:probable phosphoglycerate mutase
MAYVLLIRHGQNDWVNKQRLAGWTPGVHLNDEGQHQVNELSERLSSLPIKAIFSSPLERCMETAVALARPHGLDVADLEAIGEVRYGGWQGKKIKKLSKKKHKWYAVQHYPSRFRFPEGESLREVQQRAVSAIEQLSRQHENELIAIVSHADVIKLVLAHYLGVHIDLFQRIAVSPASISALMLADAGHVRVLRINDDGPFRLPAKPEEKEKTAAGNRHSKQEKPGSDGAEAIGTREAVNDLFSSR